jgi:hypothetical protein
MERLLVSVASLRRHYGGPATILCSRDESEPVARKIAAGYDVQVQRFQDAGSFRHATYTTKPQLPLVSPYDETVFIDADTMTVGGIGELWETDRPLTITTFSDWVSTGRIIGSRIRQWLAVSPMCRFLAETQLSRPWPAINTGVFAFKRGWRWQRLWQELTDVGRRCSFTDELSMQILTSEMPQGDYRLLNCRFNFSPIYPVQGVEPTIYHFHGDKHARRPEGHAIWWPEFMRLWESDAAGVGTWGGTFDPDVKRAIKATA